MRFEIIMNMPVRGNDTQNPALIHRLVVEYPCTGVIDFLNQTIDDDFIIVEEFFPDPATKTYKSHGLIALNRRYVGKIKEWDRK
jgi:hypothetical protein